MTPGVTTPTLLRGVDRAVFAAGLAAALRRAGLATTQHETHRFAAGLSELAPTARSELYWLARICLVNDVGELDTFDRVFDVVFEGGSLPVGRDARRSGPPPPAADDVQLGLRRTDPTAASAGGVSWASTPSATEDAPGLDSDVDLPELLPSALGELADEPFDDLSDAELALIGAWLEQLAAAWPTRRVRRTRATGRGGDLDLRATLRRAHRTAGDPVVRAWRRPRTRARRIAMLADVSGSMQTFVRPYLHVMRALATHGRAEVFAFATTITRITPALERRDPVDAVAAASDLVDDRFSGTRIATSLRRLQQHPTWSNHLRGAVVLVASDGWDTDPADDLASSMARLARTAHRVVWVNPRAGADDYEPLVAGMAAALPHCDRMLAGHTLRAMREVLVELTRP